MIKPVHSDINDSSVHERMGAMNNKPQDQTSAPKRIKRSETDRRQIFAFDHFFNPEKERRRNIKDRRYDKNRPKGDLANIFLG